MADDLSTTAPQTPPKLWDMLSQRQPTPMGEMNLLQALGLGLQDASRGFLGQPQLIPGMREQVAGRQQQERLAERELAAAMQRQERQQVFQKEMQDFDKAVDLFMSDDPDKAMFGLESLRTKHSQRLSSLGLPLDAENIGKVKESIEQLRGLKFTGTQLAIEQKKEETELARQKNALRKKDPAKLTDDDRVVLGLSQPPTAAQMHLARIIKSLPPEQAKIAALAAYGQTSAQELLVILGREKGMSYKDIAAMLRGDNDTALREFATIFAALAPYLSPQVAQQLGPLILGKAAEKAGVTPPLGGFGSKEERGAKIMSDWLKDLTKRLGELGPPPPGAATP